MTSTLLGIDANGDGALALRLLTRMAATEFRGIDPSTIDYDPRLMRLRSFCPLPGRLGRKIWKSLVNRTIYYLGYGVLGRWIRPLPQTFAKGLGLAMSTAAALWSDLSDAERAHWTAMIGAMTRELDRKRIPGRQLWTHDVPFFVGTERVPDNDPVLVTTAFVALGYHDWGKTVGDRAALERFEAIVSDLLAAIPQYDGPRGGACFGYTGTNRYCVHNANLLMAELLALSIDGRFDEKRARALEQAVRYSVDDFKRTNSYPYAGPPTENPAYDNYHTGYVLRSLAVVARARPDLAAELDLSGLLDHGLRFFVDKFVVGGLVRKDLRRVVEAHSLAEAILIRKVFAEQLQSEDRNCLDEAILRTARMLWNSRGGYFENNAKPFFRDRIWIRDRSEQIRWSTAWMAFAAAFRESATHSNSTSPKP